MTAQMTVLLNDEGLRQRGITFSPAHRWRLIQAGKFPKPVKLGGGRNSWLEAEIESWINERIAARDSGQEAA